MDYGAIGTYFEGVAAKVLAPVDVDAAKSNQHEFNGSKALRKLFGDDDIKGINTTFGYFDDEEDPVFDQGATTWYDARRNHPTRTEYRLYYKDNAALDKARAGDLVVFANRNGQHLLVLFARKGSTVESQIRWLFGFGDLDDGSFVESRQSDSRVSALGAQILELVGIEVSIPESADSYLDGLIEKFGDSFPKGKDFSAHALSTLGDLDWQNEPDVSLVAYYDREELLFRVFERYLLESDMAPYLESHDVDGILRIAMSTFQRRKSRAGTAFENQLAALFDARGIQYSAQAYTEGKSKPDFIFPSIEDYKNPGFDMTRLTMLGAKTTIKERWRQVLDEANRIEYKHLVTLEPAVSEDYTKAMEKDKLQLVVPKPIFPTFTEKQQSWLMSIADFCELVEQRQE